MKLWPLMVLLLTAPAHAFGLLDTVYGAASSIKVQRAVRTIPLPIDAVIAVAPDGRKVAILANGRLGKVTTDGLSVQLDAVLARWNLQLWNTIESCSDTLVEDFLEKITNKTDALTALTTTKNKLWGWTSYNIFGVHQSPPSGINGWCLP